MKKKEKEEVEEEWVIVMKTATHLSLATHLRGSQSRGEQDRNREKKSIAVTRELRARRKLKDKT